MQANTISQLAEPRELAGLKGTCISIYLGGHKGGSGSRPMNVRLRRLLVEAGRLLEVRGVSPADREALLAPLRAQLDDPDMEAGQGAGLAMFRTATHFEHAAVPGEVADAVAVDNRPLLAPLVRALQTHREFLLLALSKKQTRLLECSPMSYRVVPLPATVPTGLREFESFDAPDHTRGQAGNGAVKFALDTFSEKEPRHLHDFFRAVDRGLQPLLERLGLPLVLAGSTGELVAYRAVNSYARLVPGAIEASPDDGRTGAELAERGRIEMRAWHPAEALHARELYLRDGTDKRSASAEEILRAASEGRVMHLLLLDGTVSPQEDLANAAAVETWRHGGDVWCFEELPEATPMAAVFRW
jgi:hypothetical protein